MAVKRRAGRPGTGARRFDMGRSEDLSRIVFTLPIQKAAVHNWSAPELIEEGKPVALTSGKDRPDAPFNRLAAARAGHWTAP